MSSKTISTHVTTTVILGSGGYGDTLTLTSTADLAPIAAVAKVQIAVAVRANRGRGGRQHRSRGAIRRTDNQ